ETDNRVQQLIKTLDEYTQLQLSPDLPELTIAWAMLQKKIKNQPYDVSVKEGAAKAHKKTAKKKTAKKKSAKKKPAKKKPEKQQKKKAEKPSLKPQLMETEDVKI
ncbi:hypothetical protein MNBD_GAMMA09-207, partial [hydrothermal vent metagenome]